MHIRLRFLLLVTAALALLTCAAAAQTSCGPGKTCNPPNAGIAVGPAAQGDQAARARARDRAVAAWQALEKQFGNAGPAYPNIFAESLPGPRGNVQPNFFWTQSQVVRAALNLATITNDPRYFRARLERRPQSGDRPVRQGQYRHSPPCDRHQQHGPGFIGDALQPAGVAAERDPRCPLSVVAFWGALRQGWRWLCEP